MVELNQITIKQNGFTMIELMVVVFLISIIVGIAAPSFIDPIKRNAKNTFADQLKRDIVFAKDYAYVKGRPVVMCATDLGTATDCDSTNWSTGWMIYHTNADGSTTELKFTHPTSEPSQVIANATTNADTINITSQGFIAQETTIITCAHDSDRSNKDVTLVVRTSGHLEQSNGASNSCL